MKLVIVRAFTPGKLANATNQGFYSPENRSPSSPPTGFLTLPTLAPVLRKNLMNSRIGEDVEVHLVRLPHTHAPHSAPQQAALPTPAPAGLKSLRVTRSDQGWPKSGVEGRGREWSLLGHFSRTPSRRPCNVVNTTQVTELSECVLTSSWPVHGLTN